MYKTRGGCYCIQTGNACHHICADIIMAVVVPANRPCVMVSSCGMSMVMCGESSPHRDLAISAKPGGGICFCVMGPHGGVFTHWLEIVKVPVLQLETVQVLAIGVMVVSFEHPILWVTVKEPKLWALLHLL